MIISYVYKEGVVHRHEIVSNNLWVLRESLWIDMVSPTKEDIRQVEDTLSIELPTREEMQEIEISSRLYKENGSLFMTATMLAKSTTEEPHNDAVTFVLSDKILITIRYVELTTFVRHSSRLGRLIEDDLSSTVILVGLFEATIDRIADILEHVGGNLDSLTQKIFRWKPVEEEDPKPDFHSILQQIGSQGDLGAKARESLLSFNRLVTYLVQNKAARLSLDLQSRLTIVTKDIASLSDHANYLSNKVNFLLDATLGMINIEQNAIIKIFSVAAVIFLPPTVIASIYGMNFDVMPELHFKYGYPMAIILLLISAWLPYKYFKKKGWL